MDVDRYSGYILLGPKTMKINEGSARVNLPKHPDPLEAKNSDQYLPVMEAKRRFSSGSGLKEVCLVQLPISGRK